MANLRSRQEANEDTPPHVMLAVGNVKEPSESGTGSSNTFQKLVEPLKGWVPPLHVFCSSLSPPTASVVW